MIDTATDGIIFAHLILLFTISINNATYPIALIHPYDTPIRNRLTRKDKDLEFFRVRAKPRSLAEFISLRSIIRGAPLAPVFDKEGDFVVMDSADPDLFLCILSLRN